MVVFEAITEFAADAIFGGHHFEAVGAGQKFKRALFDFAAVFFIKLTCKSVGDVEMVVAGFFKIFCCARRQRTIFWRKMNNAILYVFIYCGAA